MTRLDIHRPSAIIPADYEFVAHDYYGPYADEMMGSERVIFQRHRARTGGSYSTHEHGGSCHVCGASALFVARFYHAKTNSYIVTGEDCAEKMDMGDARAFRVFRDKVTGQREAIAGKRKAQASLEAAGLGAAWGLFVDPQSNTSDAAAIVRDIVLKLVRYGSISEKQQAFVAKLLKQIEARQPSKREQWDAQRAAETAAALPVPVTDKRIAIEGVVLTVREPDDSARFPAWKMLVQHTDGWKVWGSVPSSLNIDQLKGARIRFEAAVQVSDKDPKFGFYSRPTKSEVLA